MQKNGILHNLHTKKAFKKVFFSCFVKGIFTKKNRLQTPRLSHNLPQAKQHAKPHKKPDNRLIGAFVIRVMLKRSSHPLNEIMSPRQICHRWWQICYIAIT